jgi:hypothetical protein
MHCKETVLHGLVCVDELVGPTWEARNDHSPTA